MRVRGKNAEDIFVQACADDGKIRVRLHDGGCQLRAHLSLRIVIHDQDNVEACLCYPLADLPSQFPRPDQFHIFGGAQNCFHAFAEKVTGTDQENALLFQFQGEPQNILRMRLNCPKDIPK